MTWPKYYQNQIIIPNPKARVAIISGWTKKESIKEILTTENFNKIAAIGQLYSKEGINYIIRNLYLNPNINTLILTGKDLSGSLDHFNKILENEINFQQLHPEISEEKLKEFINWFSKNFYFCQEENLNQVCASLAENSSSWTETIIDFPEAEQRENTDFPSEEVCFRLEDKKIADLWLKVLDRIIKFGRNKMSQYSEMQREVINITTVINDEDPDNPYLPEWLPFGQDQLDIYFPQLMTAQVFEGVEYTYGSRLRNFNGINQIDFIINDLKANNYSRRAIAFTWDVNKDTGNPKSPCLNLIHALIQADKLYLTCFIRSNDMFKAWPRNAFALRKVQKEIAEALNIPLGKLCIISNSAHIYEKDYVTACELLDKQKSMLECLPDPRGNFEIKIEANNILVNHYSPQGEMIQSFKGENSNQIIDQITGFISDIPHALDLGKELQKAEIAMNNNLEYKQDNNLNLTGLNNTSKIQGRFIVIDGTDGSGKGTQTGLLVEKLKQQGHQVEMADFPQYGQPSASLVEEYLNGKFGTAKDVGPYRASIFYACDRYAASFQIKQWLEQGKIVISNRYVSANMGHQAGKIKENEERDKFLDWLHHLEYKIFNIPEPDLNILLYMPPEIGQQLVEKKGHRDYVGGAKKDIHEADLEHLKDAAEAYQYVADKFNWLTIDCAPDNNLMTIEDIHKLLWEKINQELNEN